MTDHLDPAAPGRPDDEPTRADQDATYAALERQVPPNDVLLQWAVRCNKAPEDVMPTDTIPSLDPDLSALLTRYAVLVNGQPYEWPRGTPQGDVGWACGEAQRARERERRLLDDVEPYLCSCGGAIWGSGNVGMCGYSLCECETPVPRGRIDRRGIVDRLYAEREALRADRDRRGAEVAALRAALEEK